MGSEDQVSQNHSLRQPIVWAGSWLLALLMLLASARASEGRSQSSDDAAPAFDVVSIKPNKGGAAVPFRNEAPDGGFRVVGLPIANLVAWAFPETRLMDMQGLPQWTMSERFDLQATATSSRPKTAGERAAMLRGLLKDRFNFEYRWEYRATDVFNLVVARTDRRLGPDMRPTPIDCARQSAIASNGDDGLPEKRSLDLSAAPSACKFRLLWGEWEGDIAMSDLVNVIRRYATRDVIDMSGLTGHYRVKLSFDPGAERGNEGSRGKPGLSTALGQQLGLRLEAARAERPILIVDRLDRPSAN